MFDHENDPLLTTEEAAAMLGLAPGTLQFYRAVPHRDPGLPYVRINARCIRYRKSDVREFIESRIVDRRSEQ